MERKPKNNRKKRSHSGVKVFSRVVSVVFTIFTVIIAYFVYQAINRGVGLPTSSTGIVLEQPGTTAPSLETTLLPETEPSEEPTETTEAPTQPIILSKETLAQNRLAQMTLEEKVWQMFFVSPGQSYYEDGTLCPAGGVFFASQDMTDATELNTTIGRLKNDAATPLLLGVSEEGGENSTLAALGVVDAFNSAADYAENGNVQAVYDFGFAVGTQLSEAGFNLNLAPVADTINWYPDDLAGRTYGLDVQAAADMVSKAVMGLEESTMISCLKHFPNLGSSAPDGMNDVSWRPYSSYIDTDFVPFRAGIEAGAQMVLVSNMMVPDMNNGALLPSCMSENVIKNILRGELGFDGVVISDVQSHRINAVDMVTLIQAGCDIVLLPADVHASVAAVIEAINNGTLTEERINESVYRILLMKYENEIITE